MTTYAAHIGRLIFGTEGGNGTNRYLDPTFIFDFYKHRRPILHSLGAVYLRPRQIDGRVDDMLVAIVERNHHVGLTGYKRMGVKVIYHQGTSGNQQWQSGRSTTARILCSICTHAFVALAKSLLRLFMASLHSRPMCSQLCSIDIFVHLALKFN